MKRFTFMQTTILLSWIVCGLVDIAAAIKSGVDINSLWYALFLTLLYAFAKYCAH